MMCTDHKLIIFYIYTGIDHFEIWAYILGISKFDTLLFILEAKMKRPLDPFGTHTDKYPLKKYDTIS